MTIEALASFIKEKAHGSCTALSVDDLVLLDEAKGLDKEESRVIVEDGSLIDFLCRCLDFEDLVPYTLLWLQGWMVDMVESFDHTLGRMSKLSYFLTERDRFSVDIAWTWREATRAEKLLKALVKVVCPAGDDHNTRLTQTQTVALRLIASILLEIPPFRVTPMIPRLFLEDGRLLQSLLKAVSDAKDPDLFAEFTLGLMSLGLGSEFLHILSAESLHSLHVLIMPNERCGCSFCEFLRRVKKAVKFRDEFGIEVSSSFLTRLGPALISARCLPLLAKSLTCVLEDAMGQPTAENDETLLKLTQCVKLIRLSKGVSSKDIAPWMPADSVVLGWLASLTARYQVPKGGFGCGTRQFLILLAESLMVSEERHVRILRAVQKVFYQVTNATVSYFRTRQDEQFPASALETVTLYSWLLFVSLQDVERGSEFTVDDPGRTPTEGATNQGVSISTNCETQDSNNRELLATAIDLFCEVCLATDLSQMTNHWKKEVFSALTCCIGMVCRCQEYFSTGDEYRRLTLLPDKSAGKMLPSSRRLMTAYASLFPDEGCSFIRRMLIVCIMYAEKAIAIQSIN